MLHPLLNLVATQPQLLADHAEAYAELLAAEMTRAVQAWRQRLLLYAGALCGLAVGAVLAGVACMLWAALPDLAANAAWVLVAVPLLALMAAGACLWVAGRVPEGTGVQTVRGQFKADLAMLREAGGA
jgi:hypothetical protein